MEKFDPYHRWLGIPPSEHPPNHYRLLGVVMFERDLEVIEDAAERQVSHIRKYGSGRNKAAAAKILNELANAQLTLLDPEQKNIYDASLRPLATAKVERSFNWKIASAAAGVLLVVVGVGLAIALNPGEEKEISGDTQPVRSTSLPAEGSAVTEKAGKASAPSKPKAKLEPKRTVQYSFVEIPAQMISRDETFTQAIHIHPKLPPTAKIRIKGPTPVGMAISANGELAWELPDNFEPREQLVILEAVNGGKLLAQTELTLFIPEKALPVVATGTEISSSDEQVFATEPDSHPDAGSKLESDIEESEAIASTDLFDDRSGRVSRGASPAVASGSEAINRSARLSVDTSHVYSKRKNWTLKKRKEMGEGILVGGTSTAAIFKMSDGSIREEDFENFPASTTRKLKLALGFSRANLTGVWKSDSDTYYQIKDDGHDQISMTFVQSPKFKSIEIAIRRDNGEIICSRWQSVLKKRNRKVKPMYPTFEYVRDGWFNMIGPGIDSDKLYTTKLQLVPRDRIPAEILRLLR